MSAITERTRGAAPHPPPHPLSLAGRLPGYRPGEPRTSTTAALSGAAAGIPAHQDGQGVHVGVRARRLLAAGAALAAVTGLAGCTQFDAALGQRQAVVTFRNGTTVAQRLTVRTTCAKTPNVTPQQLPANLNSPYALQQVIYQIDKASDADVARLEQCLAKFPSVAGVTVQDSSDEGS